MIINTTQVEMALMNRAVSAYQLEKATGVSQSAISRLRSGERPFGNLTLETVMKIQKWIDGGHFRISYDYSELIEELVADVIEGLAGEYIGIVRGEFVEALGVCPIIDYYCDLEEIEGSDMAKEVRTLDVLAEMRMFSEAGSRDKVFGE